MRKAVLIFLILLSFSCKDENKPKTDSVNSTSEKAIKDDVLTITLDVRIKEDDKFELFYVDDFTEGGFTGDKRLATYIKPNNDFQTIEFKLPKDVFPYNFRIDLGDNVNKFETLVEIRSIKLQLNGNIIEIDSSIVDSFFQPNVFLQKTEHGYSRKVVNGKYDPFLLAKPILIKKMELEL